MDRIHIKCLIGDRETELQLDKKAMPGESGPCFMVSSEGCFKGYISRQTNGGYKSIGNPYYTPQDLLAIGEHLQKALTIASALK